MAHVAVWFAGPFLAACALLVWSGANKVVHPDATRIAARAVGLPSTRTAVRALGAIELAAAIAGAVFGGWLAALVAAVYVGLAVVALRLLARAPDTPCGCLGASEVPASRVHVGVNIGAACVAVLAGFGGSPLSVLGSQPLGGVPFVVLVLCAARLAALTIEGLPAIARASREGG
jgi:methylamine utilization protein MauE